MNIDERKLRYDLDIKRVVGDMDDHGKSMEQIRRVIGLTTETCDSIRQEHRMAKKKKKPKKPMY